MDWITGLQKAIDYIEDNLTEKLDYNEIAKKAYSSNFHFQRIFSILCGYTIGEYIRKRRLTLAGNELISTNTKIINIALKYGYDSHESFSRAFTKFHGINPSQVRINNTNLKSFSRLSVKLILEGGNIMDYRIEKKGAFKVVSKKEHFLGGQEISKKQIQEFWNKCTNENIIQKLCNYITPNSIFGDAIIGISFDTPDIGDFDYAIGAYYDGGDVDKDLSVEEIPAFTWAIFKCVGAMPEAFQKLWKKIYTEFFPASEYKPSGGMCFEVYFNDDVLSEDYVCEFWISVEKK